MGSLVADYSWLAYVESKSTKAWDRMVIIESVVDLDVKGLEMMCGNMESFQMVLEFGTA